MVMQGLMDSTEVVVDASMTTFLPVIALWLLQLDRLQDVLLAFLLKRLRDLILVSFILFLDFNSRSVCKRCSRHSFIDQMRQVSSMSSVIPSTDERKVQVIVTCLQSLIPYLFVSVVSSGPYAADDGSQSNTAIMERTSSCFILHFINPTERKPSRLTIMFQWTDSRVCRTIRCTTRPSSMATKPA